MSFITNRGWCMFLCFVNVTENGFNDDARQSMRTDTAIDHRYTQTICNMIAVKEKLFLFIFADLSLSLTE